MDMKYKINMAAQMTNSELAEAIIVAHEAEKNTHASSSKEKLWQEHLAALLEIQRGRAATCSVNNPGSNDELVIS